MTEKMKSFVKGVLLGLCGHPLPQGEPVAYLYNGVRLPAIPERDEEYSWCTIVSGTRITLYLTNYPGTGYSRNLVFKGQDGNVVKILEYRLKDGIWQDPAFSEHTSNAIGHLGFIFTNYNLYHPSTGKLTLPKSDPIPVYE
jgi:hypothetical protein